MKFGSIDSLKLVFLAIAGIPIVSLSSSTFAVSCGDTVTEPEVLDKSIEVCLTSPAVTITDSGTLDLNGYIISCSGSGIGVRILGTGRILNDSVGGNSIESCETGVSAEGNGAHFIQGINAADNTLSGITLTSNSNFVLDSSSNKNAGIGLRVLGDFNQVINSEMSDNLFPGIEIVGNSSVVNSNVTSSNAVSGIVIFGSDNSLIVGNTSNDNGTNGILMEAYSQQGNVITGNTTIDNVGNDLSDQNSPPCVGNVWIANIFGDANDACIQ
ncbi:right-handed parallel beta-helix repeat-containing protein [Microbulbifer sp. OS29]|uniref:Right-handed parallel beta-helix repeat-containing protein n=1 Tax=Microbulbifer okhotskensis TaxID=2926617 RepID=A0A9X2ES88_9GAMM|nr:right-handed parallel beta-helix repeat-containing protein [Microbulbifer okhotskensis]MCO1336864.1 right-handed parallel beta-helix repeat-containing protein [Microbulbifer okhotskensis]